MAKLGGPQAITVAAHKLVRIIYHLVTKRVEYSEDHFLRLQAENEMRARLRLAHQARRLGYALVPVPQLSPEGVS